MDPVPDPLLLRKSGSAGNRSRDLCICSQKLWPLDHRGGLCLFNTYNNIITKFRWAFCLFIFWGRINQNIFPYENFCLVSCWNSKFLFHFGIIWAWSGSSCGSLQSETNQRIDCRPLNSSLWNWLRPPVTCYLSDPSKFLSFIFASKSYVFPLIWTSSNLRLNLIFVVPSIMLYSGEISPTRCNNCVFYSQWLYSTCFGWQSHPSSRVQCCIWPQVSWLTAS